MLPMEQMSRLISSLVAVLFTKDVACFCVKAERVSRLDLLAVNAASISMGKKVLSLLPAGF